MNTAAIARHLNIVESAITRCEEWAKVLFVVVKGLGARFVSKKVMGTDEQKVTDIMQDYESWCDMNRQTIDDAWPLLLGSPKQIEWAYSIRNDMVKSVLSCASEFPADCIPERIEKAIEILKAKTSCRWWINHRDNCLADFIGGNPMKVDPMKSFF